MTNKKSNVPKGNSVPGNPAPQIPSVAAQNKLTTGPVLELEGGSLALTAVEETPTGLDLSEIKIKKSGSNNQTLVFEISATAGTIDVSSYGKLELVRVDEGTVQLIGQKTDIKKFLKQSDAITFTGAKDDFGVNATTISVSLAREGDTATPAAIEIGVNITDTLDELIGTSGNDALIGDDGMNLIVGLAGADYLVGRGGADHIQGDAGDDTIRGGAGADTLEGGAGLDVLQYTDSAGGVTVDLQIDGGGFQSASGGDADGDVISGFEHVYASSFADTVTGDDARNILFGYAGDDVLIGRGGDDVIRGGLGADTMEGGDGSDWLRYIDARSGVTINLTTDAQGFQSASRGEAEGDVISGFENFQGTSFSDVVTGSDGANYILGYAGDDIISAGAGNDIVRGGSGADTLDGGSGKDTLQYSGSSAGVTVVLEADDAGQQAASGGDAEGDVISGFENVYATNHGDTLIGDAGRNILYGYAGDDKLDGGAANDVLRGGSGADEFHFTTATARNLDRIIDFEAGFDTIVLDSDIFTALSVGALNSVAFHINDSGVAEASEHRLVYESDTGKIWYDADGTGSEGRVAFVYLSSRPTIDDTDFLIV